MRVIGMDIHRSFAWAAILEDGEVTAEKRVELVHHKVVAFGRTLRPDDEVVLEATGNTAAVERLLRPFVKRVIIANPRMVRALPPRAVGMPRALSAAARPRRSVMPADWRVVMTGSTLAAKRFASAVWVRRPYSAASVAFTGLPSRTPAFLRSASELDAGLPAFGEGGAGALADQPVSFSARAA